MKTNVNPDPRDYEIRIWYSAEKSDQCPLSVTPVAAGLLQTSAVTAEPALDLPNGSPANL